MSRGFFGHGDDYSNCASDGDDVSARERELDVAPHTSTPEEFSRVLDGLGRISARQCLTEYSAAYLQARGLVVYDRESLAFNVENDDNGILVTYGLGAEDAWHIVSRGVDWRLEDDDACGFGLEALHDALCARDAQVSVVE